MGVLINTAASKCKWVGFNMTGHLEYWHQPFQAAVSLV